MTIDLTGRVAIVHRRRRRLGPQPPRWRLAHHGARVVVNDLASAACEGVAAEIRAAGGEALPWACSVD